MTSSGGRLWEVVACDSLEYGNCRDLLHPPVQMPQCFFFPCKSQTREKKSGSSHSEISVSCTSREYDNVTTPYYPIAALQVLVVALVLASAVASTAAHD